MLEPIRNLLFRFFSVFFRLQNRQVSSPQTPLRHVDLPALRSKQDPKNPRKEIPDRLSGEKVVKNTAYLVAAFVGQKVLSFVYFTIVARAVGVDGAGKYFLAVSLTTMFSIFVDLGLANVLVREVAKDRSRAGSLLSNVLGMKVVLAVLTVVAVSVTSRILNYHPQTQLMIAIASAVMVLDSIHLVLYAAMRGFQNLRYEAIGVVGGQVVSIGAGLTFIALGLPLHFLVVALLCGSLANVLWSAIVLRRRFGLSALNFRLEPPVVRFFWRITVPFALAGIFSRVYSYIDSVMLSKLISESAVGVYGVAYKIAFAFQFLPMAFAAAVYPAMSEQYAGDRSGLSRIYTLSLSYLSLVVLPLAAGIGSLAPQFIGLLYGPDFNGAIVPLQVLMASLVFAFLYWPAGSLLNACDRQARNTLAMGLTMVVNIVLNVILIPRYGPVGAAVAALAGNLVLWSSALVFSWDVVRLDWRRFGAKAGKALVAAIIMSLVLVALRGKVSVLLLVPVGVAAYVAPALLFGAVTLSELKILASIFLRRGKGVSDLMS
ncbi:MAG: oligosaccharide flippase family protein [bacterium]